MKKIILSIFLILICNNISFGQDKLMKKFSKYNPSLIFSNYGSDFQIFCKDLEPFKEEIIKYKTKNGEDLSTVFVDFFIRLIEIQKVKMDISEFEYNNLKIHEIERFLNYVEKYSMQDLKDIVYKNMNSVGDLDALKTMIDALDYRNFQIINDERKWGDKIWAQRLYYLNDVKLNRNEEFYSKTFIKLRDLFLKEFGPGSFFYQEKPKFSVNSDWEINTDPGVRDLELLNEKWKRFPDWDKKENNFKWGEQYSFVDDELKQTVSEFLFLKSLWVNLFSNYKNDKLNKIESYEIPDCYIITDYLVKIINSGKIDSLTLQQLYEIKEFYQDGKINCNLHEVGYNTQSRIPSIKSYMTGTLIDKFISKKNNKNTGYCDSKKHKEILLEEFYPKTGFKLTKGVLKTELLNDLGCSFTWKVYDTTLSGKMRISFYSTSVKDPDDKEILVELLETDTW